jgi:hypothetical protein
VTNSARNRTDRPVGAKPVFPKLPRFVEKHDDIDSFMFRFEIYATSLNWEKSQWVTYLAALLEGNVLDLYHSLSANQGSVVTYEVLKENLLKKFQCTAEGFRKRFREARPDANEPLQTYGIGLTRLFERWIALSGVERNIEGIMNLILGEQFLESVSGELATFIRERNFYKLDDMVKAAESYRLARPGKQIARKSTATVFASVGSVDTEFESAATGYSDSRGGFSTPNPAVPRDAVMDKNRQEVKPSKTPKGRILAVRVVVEISIAIMNRAHFVMGKVIPHVSAPYVLVRTHAPFVVLEDTQRKLVLLC